PVQCRAWRSYLQRGAGYGDKSVFQQKCGLHPRVAAMTIADGNTRLRYRDIGAMPPAPVTGAWIHAAFTPAERREPWMNEVLKERDELVDELLSADIIVAGVPMYNFGPAAQFKAYIDNIVRVGRTFGFDRSRSGAPYWPLVDSGKRLVILSS